MCITCRECVANDIIVPYRVPLRILRMRLPQIQQCGNGACGHPLRTRLMVSGHAAQQNRSCAAVSTIWCHCSRIRQGIWTPSSSAVGAEKAFTKHKMGLHVYGVVKSISVQRTRMHSLGAPRARTWRRMRQRSQWVTSISTGTPTARPSLAFSCETFTPISTTFCSGLPTRRQASFTLRRHMRKVMRTSIDTVTQVSITFVEQEERTQKSAYKNRTEHKTCSARNTGRKTGREKSIHTRHRLIDTGK